MSHPQPNDEQRLRQAVADLPVGEILALCYAFSHRTDRLRLYLDVLRGRGGQRAQFAACMVCFDLARQGDPRAQEEFFFLSDTIRDLASDRNLVEGLIGDDGYLALVWELLTEQLGQADARFAGEQPLPEVLDDVAGIELLSDDDFEELGLDVSETALHGEFQEAMEEFLGGDTQRAIYDPDAGFRLHNRRDGERVEKFLRALDSFRDWVPPARGLRALLLLFYGTHIRSKTFFGGLNERKQRLLRDGVAEFLQSGAELQHMVGVLDPMHAEPTAWAKVSEVLLDYLHWSARFPAGACPGPTGYPAVERQIARDAKRPKRRRRRRA